MAACAAAVVVLLALLLFFAIRISIVSVVGSTRYSDEEIRQMAMGSPLDSNTPAGHMVSQTSGGGGYTLCGVL